MARFVAEMPTGKPDDMVRFIAEDYLNKEGFKQKIYKGEQVWKKGTGMLTAPQFIKFSTYQGNVHLEAWIKQAILPGVYVGEMGLNGAYGFAIKKLLKDLGGCFGCGCCTACRGSCSHAVAVPVPRTSRRRRWYRPVDGVSAPLPAYPGAEGIPAGMPPYTVPPVQPIPLAVHNPSGKAVASLICGLVSIAGCFVPLAGVACGIAGIVTGNMGRKSTAKGMATAGLALSIVFLTASLVNWMAGIYLNIIGAL